jgi:hypothetical protein
MIGKLIAEKIKAEHPQLVADLRKIMLSTTDPFPPWYIRLWRRARLIAVHCAMVN